MKLIFLFKIRQPLQKGAAEKSLRPSLFNMRFLTSGWCNELSPTKLRLGYAGSLPILRTGATMKKLFMLMFLSLAAARACAVDGVFIEYGLGNASVISSSSMVEMYRVGALWKWDKSWLNDGDWHVTGFWEASLGSWRGFEPGGNNLTITDIGITPVFRLAQKAGSGMSPYLEGGFLGMHLISPTSIYSGRNFSTAFQFGDALGFGVSLGEHRQFDLGYRFQHLSNGNIKKPNNGVDFNQIHFAYLF